MRAESGIPRSLALVLPAYNEAIALRTLLPRINSFVAGSRIPVQVIVVDDGSEDSTAATVLGFGEERTRLLTHSTNQGFGAALNTGLLAAVDQVDAVITMDADDTHDPLFIPELLEALSKGSDVVIASRYLPGAEQTGVPVMRRLLSRWANKTISLALGKPRITDFSSGYRLLRSSVLRKVLQGSTKYQMVNEVDFAATVELLFAARAHGARITEVPIKLRYDRKPGPSAMRFFRVLLRCVLVAWRYARRSARDRPDGSKILQPSAGTGGLST